jgi:hypothetical protein
MAASVQGGHPFCVTAPAMAMPLPQVMHMNAPTNGGCPFFNGLPPIMPPVPPVGFTQPQQPPQIIIIVVPAAQPVITPKAVRATLLHPQAAANCYPYRPMPACCPNSFGPGGLTVLEGCTMMPQPDCRATTGNCLVNLPEGIIATRVIRTAGQLPDIRLISHAGYPSQFYTNWYYFKPCKQANAARQRMHPLPIACPPDGNK